MTRPPELDWPDDETLVAYADGTLDAAVAARIAAQMAHDPDLRDFIELLTRSGRLAREAFETETSKPRDDALAAMILNSAPPEEGRANEADRSNNIIPLSRPRARPAGFPAYALPMAAAIALMIGGLAGFQIGQREGGPSAPGVFDVAVGPVSDGSALASLLEKRGSGDPLPVSGDQREVMVIATFRDRAGRVCREFEVTDTAVPENGITAAVACRGTEGGWRVEGAASVASIPAASDQDFSPASGDGASAIEGILKAVGAKPALSKADEQSLLKDGWK